MTLNDRGWPFALKSVSGSATNELAFLNLGENCSKICRATYILSATKCSPGILVSSKVRFICIFAGVFDKSVSPKRCKRGHYKWEWCRRINGNFRFFRSLYLPNLRMQGHNYYIVLCSPLVVLHWHQNGWPSMTFNGHFALKSASSSASNGLAFSLSEKTVRKFAELRI